MRGSTLGGTVGSGERRDVGPDVGSVLSRSVGELVDIEVGFGVGRSTGDPVGLAVGGRGGKGSVIALKTELRGIAMADCFKNENQLTEVPLDRHTNHRLAARQPHQSLP
jgi:hypothetical protein